MSNKEKRCRFMKRLDDLSEEGEVNLIKSVRSDENLRTMAYRIYGSYGGVSSTQRALEDYGYRFHNYFVTDADLEDCLSVSDDFEILMDNTKLNRLMDVCNTERISINNRLKEIRDILYKDVLGDFIESVGVENISGRFLRRSYPHIYSAIYRLFDSFESFRNAYGIDKRLSFYENNYKEWFFINLGLEFEEFLKENVFFDAEYQPIYGNCIPDFVENGEWIDSKLSKSTALDKRSTTIEKYTKVVDKLKIVYAFEDECDLSVVGDSVEFVHVSEYYERLSKESIKEMESIIERTGRLKGLTI